MGNEKKRQGGGGESMFAPHLKCRTQVQAQRISEKQDSARETGVGGGRSGKEKSARHSVDGGRTNVVSMSARIGGGKGSGKTKGMGR